MVLFYVHNLIETQLYIRIYLQELEQHLLLFIDKDYELTIVEYIYHLILFFANNIITTRSK